MVLIKTPEPVQPRLTAHKMKFSIKDFFGKCDQIRVTADLVTFPEGILNGKLYFLCSVSKCPGCISNREHYWKFSPTQTLTYRKQDSKLFRTWYLEMDLNSDNHCTMSQALGFTEAFIIYF